MNDRATTNEESDGTGPVALTDDMIISLPLARTPEAIAKHGDAVAYLLADTEVVGLSIKIGQTVKIWQVSVRPPGGEKMRRKLGDYGETVFGKDAKGVERSSKLNVGNARRKAQNWIAKIREGLDPSKENREKIAKVQADQRETLLWALTRKVRGWQTKEVDTRATLEKYIADNAKTLGKHKVSDWRDIIRHLADWLDLPLRDLDWRMVAARFQKVSAEPNKQGLPKKTTANRLFRNLRGLINDWLSLHPGERLENPVNILKKSDKRAEVTWHADNQRDGWVSTKDDGDEFVAWWRAVQAESRATIRDYLLLTVLQGAREVETAQLEWRHIDFGKGTILYEKTKNGRDYKFPMTPYIRAMLKRRSEDENRHEKWVFSAGRVRRKGDPMPHVSPGQKDAVVRISAREGVSAWQMHDLRRTFKTTLAILGVDDNVSEYLQKHTLRGVKANYDKSAILAPDALLKYENYLLELVRKDDERRKQVA